MNKRKDDKLSESEADFNRWMDEIDFEGMEDRLEDDDHEDDEADEEVEP